MAELYVLSMGAQNSFPVTRTYNSRSSALPSTTKQVLSRKLVLGENSLLLCVTYYLWDGKIVSRYHTRTVVGARPKPG